MTPAHDFIGLATKYEVPCKDGRTIELGAFDHQDGQIVPLVWRHGHDDIRNIIGHAVLTRSEQPPGMRATGVFNKTQEGAQARLLVESGDVNGLSIYANELEQRPVFYPGVGQLRGVKTGTIREVSIVPAGSNPGAVIEDVVIHSMDSESPDFIVVDGIIAHSDSPIEAYVAPVEETEEEEPAEEELAHGEDDTLVTILKTLSDDQVQLFDIVLHSAQTGEKTPPEKPNSDDIEGPTVAEVFATLNEEQKTVLYYMAGELSQEENLTQGDIPMQPQTHNIFETATGTDTSDKLSHEQVLGMIQTAINSRAESLRQVLAHSITDIDFLFPDAQNVEGGGPMLYAREMGWVDTVLNATKTRPFSRIKSWYADITADEARAKGYVTGEQKVEEVIQVLKRVTTPQTIYKLQKLDRDDIIDITDFDVIIWLKSEMRMMLREELARAVLVSDGRLISDDDKIQEGNVRPIWTDDAVYTTEALFHDVGNEEELVDLTQAQVLDLIDFISSSRQYYKGSGSPTFYCTTEALTKMLQVRDTLGRRIHANEADLASALRVRNIVEVPPMSNLVEEDRSIGANDYDILTLGVIVNLQDYVIGADKGGQTAFFEDFDLNFNKHEYLYETRVSGALVRPKSAIHVNLVTVDNGETP